MRIRKQRPRKREPLNRSRSLRSRLQFEQLESRRLLAVFRPDTFDDDNDGNTSPGDFSLREAIILANSNNQADTIELEAGTYELTIRGADENASLTGDLDIGPDNGFSLTIEGQGAGLTVISADAGPSLNDRVFQIFDLASVSIDSLTITGGDAPGDSDGGAILSAGNVLLSDVVVTGNHASRDGGGVAIQGISASMVIDDSVISDNEAEGFGGGIHNMSSMVVRRTTISNNLADDGAGVANRSNAQARGSLAMSDSTISGNIASNRGGGIYNSDNLVTFALSNSTISGNEARFGAGVFNIAGAQFAISSTTITANDASNRGGGIRSEGGLVDLKNTIVAGNLGTDPDIQSAGGSFNSSGHNLIGNRGTANGFINGVNGDQVGSSSAPINARLGPLAENGGPTKTHAISSQSPALDAGDNNGAPATDQRGMPRPVGPAVDIGAYELSMDLGDAPQGPYPTRLDRNGAAHAHGAPLNPRLGSRIDYEVDGQPNATATGDDINNLDDEDGVIFPTGIRAGEVDARVNVTASVASVLDAWIDFHGDGNWDAASDQIFIRQPLVAGLNSLSFVVPPDARVGQTFARFRVTSAGSPGPRGFAFDGEVEDYQITISATSGTGTFAGGASLGIAVSRDLALGDIDNDGDLDAFVANDNAAANRVWVNQGGLQGGTVGVFLDSGQSIGFSSSQAVVLGDVDSDGDLDAFVANGTAPDRVYLNQGNAQGGMIGTFATNGQALGLGNSQDVALGDLDGDGDLDAVGANLTVNRVLFNQAGAQGGVEGQFGDALSFGNAAGHGVALGDFDQDGDLDVFIANTGANRVWVNQGGAQGGVMGTLVNSGQSLGASDSRAVFVGDLDGDGDLDAFIANAAGQANRVWTNQGGMQGGVAGVFLDSGQSLGNSDSRDVALGDFDGDGDLDAFVANTSGQPNRVYINQGGAQGGSPATFLSNGQSLGAANSDGVQLGDLDLDGDLDAMVANASPNRIWLNQIVQPIPTYNFSAANYSDAEADTTSSVVMLTRSVATTASSSVDVVLTGVSAMAGVDFATGPITVSFAAGETSKVVPIELFDDALDENNETFSLSLTNFLTDGEAGASQPTATFTILDDDPSPTVTLTATPLSIVEPGGQSTVTATLSAVSGRTVTVAMNFAGTATGGGVDYTISATQITIPANSLTGSATVTAQDDLIDDDDETVEVSITNVTNGTESGTQQVTITITDNDDAGAGTTTVSLLNGVLIIEDAVDEDTDDQLTLSIVGASLRISDPGNAISTNVPGATGDGTNQVTVPLAQFSAVSVRTKGGTDSLTLDASITAALAATISFDGGADDDTLFVDAADVEVAIARLIDVDTVDTRGATGNTVNFTFASVQNNVDNASDALVVLTDPGDTVQFDTGWSIPVTFMSGGNFFRSIRQGTANVHVAGPHDWQNPLNNRDINTDGEVVALDALQIINEINNPRFSNANTGELVDAKSLPQFSLRFYDANGDGFVTPGDVLLIINFINMQAGGGGEGEAEGLLEEAAGMVEVAEGLVEEAFRANAAEAANGLTAADLVIATLPPHNPSTIPPAGSSTGNSPRVARALPYAAAEQSSDAARDLLFASLGESGDAAQHAEPNTASKPDRLPLPDLLELDLF